jgi:hypothetical protein
MQLIVPPPAAVPVCLAPRLPPTHHHHSAWFPFPQQWWLWCLPQVDATRQLELRCLPPVLCFSLQRFVFDFNRMDRVKVGGCLLAW